MLFVQTIQPLLLGSENNIETFKSVWQKNKFSIQKSSNIELDIDKHSKYCD